MNVLAAQNWCKLFHHVNHVAFASRPSVHPHRPPYNLPCPFCTSLQSLYSLLCCAGGEAVEAVSTAASKAAEEAATGSWLKQLESGSLPRITAPGLSQGWFGPWETKEDALDHSDAAGRCRIVFQPSLQFQAGLAWCNIASALRHAACSIIDHAWCLETAECHSHLRVPSDLLASDRC